MSAVRFLVSTDSLGNLYPGGKGYTGDLQNEVFRHFGAEVQFKKGSGLTLSGILANALPNIQSASHVLIASMGNDLVDNRHKVVSELPNLDQEMQQLKDIARSRDTFVVYGASAAAWELVGTEAHRYDLFVQQIVRYINDIGIPCVSGANEIRAFNPIKASSFHFSIDSRQSVVAIWMQWFQIALQQSGHKFIASASPPPPPPIEPRVPAAHPSSPAWIHQGKCYLCAVHGKEANQNHLDSRKHNERATRPWDFIDDRIGLPADNVVLVKSLMPDEPVKHEVIPSEATGPQQSTWALLEMTRQELGSMHDFIARTSGVFEPMELASALHEDGMLVGLSWLNIAQYVDVVCRRLRRDGYDLPYWVTNTLAGNALRCHEAGKPSPSTNDELCREIGLTTRFTGSLFYVKCFSCKQCGAACEDAPNWPRPTPKHTKPDPPSHRWCAACWSKWATEDWAIAVQHTKERCDDNPWASMEGAITVTKDDADENPWASMKGVITIFTGTVHGFCEAANIPPPTSDVIGLGEIVKSFGIIVEKKKTKKKTSTNVHL